MFRLIVVLQIEFALARHIGFNLPVKRMEMKEIYNGNLGFVVLLLLFLTPHKDTFFCLSDCCFSVMKYSSINI